MLEQLDKKDDEPEAARSPTEARGSSKRQKDDQKKADAAKEGG